MRGKTYEPKQKLDISYFVNARQKTYLNSTEIYLPNDPYEKILEGYELSKDYHKPTGAPIPTSEEDKLDRSKRRIYTAVKDMALSNVFELFVTFTFKAAYNS
jgi:hypothetical protein